LAGKILRVTEEGKAAPGNPFGSLVYSYGHRNPQGIAWDSSGRLWATEHGRSGVRSGLDEINLIEPGNNYGWPVIEGDETGDGMENPMLHSGPAATWAPGGSTFIEDVLFFTGLRGQAVYRVDTLADTVSPREYFKNEFGRIRDIVTGPDAKLYLATSNRDGRGKPIAGDDRIIRVDPNVLGIE
jgi:glucose/arabinose dehydrogenase